MPIQISGLGWDSWLILSKTVWKDLIENCGEYVQSSNNKENDDDFWKLIQVVINFEVDCNASGRQSTEVGQ